MNQGTSKESQNADLDRVRDPKGPQERKHVTRHALKQKWRERERERVLF